MEETGPDSVEQLGWRERNPGRETLPAEDMPPRIPWKMAPIFVVVSLAVSASYLVANQDGVSPVLPIFGIPASLLLVAAALWSTWGDISRRWPESDLTRINPRTAVAVAFAAWILATTLSGFRVGFYSPICFTVATTFAIFGFCAYIDIRTRKIPMPAMWLAIFSASPTAAITAFTQYQDWGADFIVPWLMIIMVSLLVPVLFSIVSFFFPYGLGAGDTRLMWVAWFTFAFWTPPDFLLWAVLAACAIQITTHLILAVWRKTAARQKTALKEDGARKMKALPFGPALVFGMALAMAYLVAA